MGQRGEHPRFRRREPHRRDGRRASRRPAGETGAPGAPGTQISLETDAPGDEPCQADGDLYIYLNTGAAEFYECTDAKWTLVWPVPTAEGATPAPTEGTNG